jgi:hypothetical protein
MGSHVAYIFCKFTGALRKNIRCAVSQMDKLLQHGSDKLQPVGVFAQIGGKRAALFLARHLRPQRLASQRLASRSR